MKEIDKIDFEHGDIPETDEIIEETEIISKPVVKKDRKTKAIDRLKNFKF